jgi:hypothetical protein
MKRVLFCKACGSPLTPALTVVSEKTPGIAPPKLFDGRSPTPRGTVFESYRPWHTSPRGKAGHLHILPQMWMGLDDLLGEPRYTPLVKRLNGCCGLDGCDGPNRLCQCGAHIGTELSDCWTPRMFIPDPLETEWRDVRDLS